MGGHTATSAAETESTPLLEAIRRKEGEVKRRLAAENEAARAALVQAERRGREMIAAAEAEGQREGNVQRQGAQAEAEDEAQAIVARARAEAELLHRVGAQRMEVAIRRVVEMVTEVRR